MAQSQAFSGEIGRGRPRRNDDSSSSRESSPSSGRSHRSFSPAASDDGDTAIPPAVQKDDLPNVEAKPLIRQSVAFSANVKAASISTYEASPVVKPKPGAFLPGQEVVVVPKKKPKTPKPKKPTTPKAPTPKPSIPAPKPSSAKRPRRPEAYAQQTSRFRLSTYDPTPTEQPPINQGTGPYSSLYRGVVPKTGGVGTGGGGGVIPLLVSSPGHSSSSRSPDPTSGPSRSQSASTPPASQGSAPTRAKSLEPSIAQDPHPLIGSSSRPSLLPLPPVPPPHVVHLPSRAGQDRSHYRSEYVDNASERTTAASRRRLPSHWHSQEQDVIMGDSCSEPSSSNFRARLVTLFIQDLRSGEVDHQLAEVRVPVQDSGCGISADMKDIAEELQKSQSRIDGPARAYIVRGKYRQFVFRVSAENRDDIGSVNVGLQPDYSLHLYVEALQPPGAPPSKPRTSIYNDADQDSDVSVRDNGSSVRKRRPKTADPYDYGDSRGSVPPSFSPKIARREYLERSPRAAAANRHLYNPTPLSRPSHHAQQQRTSRSPEYYSNPNPHSASGAVLPEHHSKRNGTGHRSMGSCDSMSDDEGDVHYRRSYAGSLKALLESRYGGATLRGAKGVSLVLELVDLLRTAHTLVSRFEGQHVPGFDKRIEKDDILDILQINKPEDSDYFWNNCEETLKLWELYGQGGAREDKQVMAFIYENKVASGMCLHVTSRLLRALREADSNWKRSRAEAPPPPLPLPSGPSTTTSPSSASSPPSSLSPPLRSPREGAFAQARSATPTTSSPSFPTSPPRLSLAPAVVPVESRASKAMFVQ